MTAEVCIMNRLAAVLAADSATTVTRWVDGEEEKRYFKGANKVFQLSDKHPVGLMIFDSAAILNVPWEIIIKTFRSNLGDKSFNTVEEYARELFAFLNDSSFFFPEEVQTEQVLGPAKAIAIGMISEAIDGLDAAEHADAIEAAFSARRDELASVDVSSCLGVEHMEKTIQDLRERMEIFITEFSSAMKWQLPGDVKSIAETCLADVVKNPDIHLGTTGLVFAGFGDHEIFPAMVEYLSCGVVGGKHIYRRESGMAIDHETPAWLSAFAQTSMTDTFSMGLSQDVYESMAVAISENLHGFASQISEAAGGDISVIDDLEGLVQATRSKIGKSVLDNARKEHSFPLRRVIGVLPVDEMAELAETLITLQSLKEKVTKPSETVGGPVDVAVITKHEGLVWIKRKHFFNLDINSRYSLRQAALHS